MTSAQIAAFTLLQVTSMEADQVAAYVAAG
jgi:hypothetical protein